MTVARLAHAATMLGNGLVLIDGGTEDGHNSWASTELYDPTVGVFATAGSMTVPRAGHTATLLGNRMVLIDGGFDGSLYLASAEIYDPSAGTFLATGSMTVARVRPTATLLGNGLVLIGGGANIVGGCTPHGPCLLTLLPNADLYDPVTGTFTTTGTMAVARVDHSATLLGSGIVLIAGGSGDSETLASAELYQ
jgi:hypothetical protein